jgi:hypothetical protein
VICLDDGPVLVMAELCQALMYCSIASVGCCGKHQTCSGIVTGPRSYRVGYVYERLLHLDPPSSLFLSSDYLQVDLSDTTLDIDILMCVVRFKPITPQCNLQNVPVSC